MPAEWEPHRATWIAWPHFEPDWPGKLAPIPWVYGEIARVLADFEPVEILCHSEPVYENAGAILESHAVRADHIRLHLVPNDRTWLRDSAPTGVVDPSGAVSLLNWSFNAWAKYANWRVDAQVGRAIAEHRAAAAGRADASRQRRADGARGRRHRDQRRRPAARHRGMAAEQRPGAQSRADARGLRAGVSRLARRAQDDLARRRLRGRRHARTHRRHRAVRRARHDRPRGRRGSGRREPREIDGQRPAAGARPRAIRRSGR